MLSALLPSHPFHSLERLKAQNKASREEWRSRLHVVTVQTERHMKENIELLEKVGVMTVEQRALEVQAARALQAENELDGLKADLRLAQDSSTRLLDERLALESENTRKDEQIKELAARIAQLNRDVLRERAREAAASELLMPTPFRSHGPEQASGHMLMEAEEDELIDELFA